MPKPWPALSMVLLLAVAGCGGGDQPTPAPSAAPTRIAQLDTAQMRVVRVAFCDLVPKKAVRTALAAAATRTRSWRNGDPVPDAGGELGHEFGCAWSGPHGTAARAWVLARPVAPAFAQSLLRAADRDPGCHARSTAGFGTPALVQTCQRAGTPRRIRHAGLFGDSWLTCEVSAHGPISALRTRADAWCASVANALNAG